DHVFELFQPFGGYRHVISSLLSDRRRCRLWSSPSIEPIGLTKKRATFGPLSRATVDAARLAPANPSQPLEITLFFPGCDPHSAQVCHYRPRTRPGRKGRKRLSFSGPTQAWAARIGSLAIATSKETAGHRTSSGQTMPDEGQGVRSTDRETQTISRRRRRRKQSWGPVVEGFWFLAREIGR